MWLCKCSCGNNISVNRRCLIKGDTKSCGCYKRDEVLQRHKKAREEKIGKRFGKLLVESVFSVSDTTTSFNCSCDCGNKTVVTNSNLLSNHTTSCGYRISEATLMRNEAFRENMIGQRFGRLVVKEIAEVGRGITKYLCLCDCGTESKMFGTNLSRGNTTSCGCYAREKTYERMTTHGLSHHRLYGIWNSIIQRCTNQNCLNYFYYENKGVKICDEWRYSFKAFYDWAMANGYQDHLTIDRYPDRKGNYEPDNCRWATQTEQSRNRDIVKLSFEDAEKIRRDDRSQVDIARDYNVLQTTISSIKRNKIWKAQ